MCGGGCGIRDVRQNHSRHGMGHMSRRLVHLHLMMMHLVLQLQLLLKLLLQVHLLLLDELLLHLLLLLVLLLVLHLLLLLLLLHVHVLLSDGIHRVCRGYGELRGGERPGHLHLGLGGHTTAAPQLGAQASGFSLQLKHTERATEQHARDEHKDTRREV